MTEATVEILKPFTLSIVVSLFNEEETMDAFFAEILPVVESITPSYEILCVNDGSTDNSAEKLFNYYQKNKNIKSIHFSRNFGKEIALSAGLDHAIGDAVIPMDIDLQDPPSLLPSLVAKWQEGFKVVLATRHSRKESWIKRLFAAAFYRVMHRLSPVEIPRNTGDFRLMDRKVVEVVKLIPERTRFMKGIFAWVGFSTATLYYDRPNRLQGKSRLNFTYLWRLALDGIFAFSTVPLKVWSYIGGFISLLSLGYATYLVVRTMLFGVDQPGYASIMTAILFMGGIQLLSLGILGEYIGRIYGEVKHRPLYVVDNMVGVNVAPSAVKPIVSKV